MCVWYCIMKHFNIWTIDISQWTIISKWSMCDKCKNKRYIQSAEQPNGFYCQNIKCSLIGFQITYCNHTFGDCHLLGFSAGEITLHTSEKTIEMLFPFFTAYLHEARFFSCTSKQEMQQIECRIWGESRCFMLS